MAGLACDRRHGRRHRGYVPAGGSAPGHAVAVRPAVRRGRTEGEAGLPGRVLRAGPARDPVLAPLAEPRRRPGRREGGGAGMRNAHLVADIRVAERALMATMPEGALMQRAVAGLASVCAGLLGRVYGASVVVLAGSGDNGGDALHAGAVLARRGAVVTAVAV